MSWIVCAAALLAAPHVGALQRPDLIGTWQLDEKQSEDPAKKLRPLEPGEDPSHPGTTGEDPTHPGEPGEPGEWSGGADRDQPRRGDGFGRRGRRDAAPRKLVAPAGLGEFFDAPRVLTISGDPERMTLTDEHGNRLDVPLDGTIQKDGAISYAGKWEGSSLVIEKTNEAGARLTTRFNLMPGADRQLEVYARLAGENGHAVTLRRVYAAQEQP